MSSHKDYLLDTNILPDFIELKQGKSAPHLVALKKHLDVVNAASSRILICVITPGEVAYGLRAAKLKDPDKQKLAMDVVNSFPALEINKQVAVETYAELRRRLFERFQPARKKKVRRPEQLVDPVTAKELGIQENDLWIAAVAMHYNLVLVTKDDMSHIKTVAGNDIEFTDWLT